MPVQDPIRKFTRGSAKVKLPGGIVGKTCYLLMAIAGALAAIVAAVRTESIGFAAIGALTLIVLPTVWRLIGFADKHPDAAILEGGEWVAYQIQLAQKGIGVLPDAPPEAAVPEPDHLDALEIEAIQTPDQLPLEAPKQKLTE
ncbi:MAG: hypothetical protein ABSC03_00065 [Verrucomicrobiota bacterium]|jgi:hypothetical protein